jgi:hypothetical protein
MVYLPAGVIVGGAFLLAADALIPRRRVQRTMEG